MQIGVLAGKVRERLAFLGQESRLAAQLLMEHYTGKDALFTALNPDYPTDGTVEQGIMSALRELELGRPLQYVLREAWFYGRPFYVDERVLIPRPETEELVRWALDGHGREQAIRVADWCTGSGCIAITLAKERPSWRCEGWDVSAEALQVARENARRQAVSVRWEERDLLALQRSEEEKSAYRLMLSNPPYVREQERAGMSERVKAHEPSMALFVPDSDPLLFYRALAEWAQYALEPGGQWFMEINEALSGETLALLRSYAFDGLELRRDMQGKCRMIKAIKI